MFLTRLLHHRASERRLPGGRRLPAAARRKVLPAPAGAANSASRAHERVSTGARPGRRSKAAAFPHPDFPPMPDSYGSGTMTSMCAPVSHSSQRVHRIRADCQMSCNDSEAAPRLYTKYTNRPTIGEGCGTFRVGTCLHGYDTKESYKNGCCTKRCASTKNGSALGRARYR
jgi:hypothetical protein